ncbi:DinB family protein [Gracilibacillus suaedae]|uniref:DinB family protein n=1 Tax=Gracilibacillus suaedae TaxID=2820273 RepID=UPI001ABDD32F|nr:DinB family protein [Gracilibacillus suaedae]
MLDYRITPREKFDDRIGELVSMLELTRNVTLQEISNLSQDDLDFLATNTSNSIGALLSHIASIEFVHQIISFEERDLNESELAEWRTALELGEKGRKDINNQPLDYYVNNLTQVRERTLTYLEFKNDSWLFKEHQWENDVSYNHYYLWFHVMEDEINHRGQIRTIKRVLKNNK